MPITTINPQSILAQLNQYRKDGKYCDILLKVGVSEFPCHRTILVGALEYFDTMFSGNFVESNRKEICLPEVDEIGFTTLLNYIYTGEASLDESNIKNILPVASYLGAACLVRKCVDYIAGILDIENAFQYHFFADEIVSDELSTYTQKYIQENFPALVRTHDFLELPFKMLHEFVSDDYTFIANEEIMFDSIMKWVYHDKNKRSQYLPLLIEKIRFQLMDVDYINGCVLQDSLISGCLKLQKLIKKKTVTIDNYRRSLRNIYMFGYQGCNLREIEAVQYDGVQWKQIPDMKQKVVASYFQTVLCGGIIYCLTYSIANKSSTLSYFQEQNKRWISLLMNGIKAIPVYNLVSLDCYNTVYANTLSFDFHNVYSYNTDLGSWDTFASPNTKTDSACLVSSKNVLYSFGGVNGKSSFVDSAEMYDPRVGKWIYTSKMAEKISHAAGVRVNNKIYITGGYGVNGSINTVKVYDIRADKWSYCTPMDSNQLDHSIVFYQNKLYLVGGKHSTIQIYDLNCDEWEHGPDIHTFDENRFVATVY